MMFGTVILVVIATILVVYVLFQKHAFPEPVARVLSRFYFYPTLPLTYLTRRTNYWTAVDDKVFVGAAPVALFGHVSMMQSQGIGVVLNMCDEYSGPVSSYRRAGIEQIRLPVVDHSEPSVLVLKQAIDIISTQTAKGKKVLIHCKGGNGRSAAVGFCWLLYKHRMTLKQAQEHLYSLRQVRKGLYKQRNIVQYYSEVLAKTTSKEGK